MSPAPKTEQPRRSLIAAKREWAPIIILILIAAGLWSFAEIADEVMEGQTQSLDRRILLAMREADDPTNPIGPAWLEEAARDMTALGGMLVLGLLTVAVCGFFVLQGRGRTALFVLSAVLGGLLASIILKSNFDRARPDLVPHLSKVYTTSFPSGHSMMSATTYLTLGAVLARAQTKRRLKLYFIGVALFITLLVGLSRVYVGVHWPTDVLAGWTAGGVWASLCWLLAWWLQRKRGIEPADAPNPTPP